MKKLLFVSSILMGSLLLNAQTYPFSENFNAVVTSGSPATGPLPTGWTTTSNFMVYANHGTFNSNACSAELNNAHPKDTLVTPLIGPVSANTKIYLQYRFVNAALYPSTGATLGAGDQVTIDAYAFGMWNANIATVPNPSVATTSFTTYTYACSLCGSLPAGTSVQLRLDIARATANADWFIDIDNIQVADNVAGIQYNALNPPALLVYPNPSTGNFTVWLKNYQANNSVEVSVYNYIGQKVKTVTAQGAVNNQIQVNSLGLEKGMYLVEVKSGDEIAKSKIQIE